jgi:hypothetical protein
MNGRAGFGVLARRVPRRSAALRFGREVGLDHSPSNALDFEIEDYASTCPFFYGSEESPDLLRSIERQYLDPGHEIDRWARQFLRRQGPTGTRELLAAMTHAIKERFTYVSRHGVQIVAAPWQESGALRVARALERDGVTSAGVAHG